MKILNKACVLLVAIIACTAASAIIADEAPKHLLDDIQQQLSTDEHLRGHFKQKKHLPDVDFPITSTGRFEFWREKRLVWNIIEPITSRLTITPDTLVQEGENGVLFRTSTNEQPVIGLVADIFFATLAGDWHVLGQHFSIAGDSSEQEWSVTMTPKSASMASYVDSIDVVGNQHINKLIFYETSGDKTEILFFDVISQ